MTPSRSALEEGFAFDEAGRPQEAFDAFRRAVALDPANGRAWRQLGDLLRRAGRLADASDCFEQAIAHGDDPALNRFFLSAVGVGPVPPQAPPGFVAALYDQYAGRFDAHLQQDLGYRGPERLATLLAEHLPGPWGDVLDLGCGTGLAGQALRARAGRLEGVDLSPGMLARAAARGVYDRLDAAPLLDHLEATPRRHDLVVACEVFIYLGDLGPVFRGLRRVLRPGGHAAFTTEACGAPEGYDLLPTLRYAHSEAGVRALAASTGFRVTALVHDELRRQDGEPVDGLFVLLAPGPAQTRQERSA